MYVYASLWSALNVCRNSYSDSSILHEIVKEGNPIFFLAFPMQIRYTEGEMYGK